MNEQKTAKDQSADKAEESQLDRIERKLDQLLKSEAVRPARQVI